jgi:hypothetical protein
MFGSSLKKMNKATMFGFIFGSHKATLFEMLTFYDDLIDIYIEKSYGSANDPLKEMAKNVHIESAKETILKLSNFDIDKYENVKVFYYATVGQIFHKSLQDILDEVRRAKNATQAIDKYHNNIMMYFDTWLSENVAKKHKKDSPAFSSVLNQARVDAQDLYLKLNKIFHTDQLD